MCRMSKTGIECQKPATKAKATASGTIASETVRPASSTNNNTTSKNTDSTNNNNNNTNNKKKKKKKKKKNHKTTNNDDNINNIIINNNTTNTNNTDNNNNNNNNNNDNNNTNNNNNDSETLRPARMFMRWSNSHLTNLHFRISLEANKYYMFQTHYTYDFCDVLKRMLLNGGFSEP